MNIVNRLLVRFSKPFCEKVKQGDSNHGTVNHADNLGGCNVVRKSYNQQRNSADYKESPCTELKHPLNSFHSTHSILQTFLDISPLALMFDIGNKIISRKYYKRDKQLNANKTFTIFLRDFPVERLIIIASHILTL